MKKYQAIKDYQQCTDLYIFVSREKIYQLPGLIYLVIIAKCWHCKIYNEKCDITQMVLFFELIIIQLMSIYLLVQLTTNDR